MWVSRKYLESLEKKLEEHEKHIETLTRSVVVRVYEKAPKDSAMRWFWDGPEHDDFPIRNVISSILDHLNLNLVLVKKSDGDFKIEKKGKK